jgi:hypothetical protein
MNVKTLSVIHSWGWKYFHSHVQLTETHQWPSKAAFRNPIHNIQAASRPSGLLQQSQ